MVYASVKDIGTYAPYYEGRVIEPSGVAFSKQVNVIMTCYHSNQASVIESIRSEYPNIAIYTNDIKDKVVADIFSYDPHERDGVTMPGGCQGFVYNDERTKVLFTIRGERSFVESEITARYPYADIHYTEV